MPSWFPFFRAVKSHLSPSSGKVLIITRMPTAEHYPFFPLAEEAWSSGSGTPYPEYAKVLEMLNYTVTTEVLEHTVVVNKDEWFEMIRNRFWSTFAGMSDTQLEDGIANLNTRLAGGAFDHNTVDNTLKFTDKLAFISAQAPPSI